jgi:phosphosulfolactate phosphohydrolase-like enzyme
MCEKYLISIPFLKFTQVGASCIVRAEIHAIDDFLCIERIVHCVTKHKTSKHCGTESTIVFVQTHV